MYLQERSSAAFRIWIPLAVATCAITFIFTTALTHLALERNIVGSVIAGAIVFSGFFFRSVGKDKEMYKKSSKPTS
jgi:hypothetical protein